MGTRSERRNSRTRTRTVAIVGIVVAVLALGGTAWAMARSSGDETASPSDRPDHAASSTTTQPPSTSTSRPTLAQPEPASLPDLAGGTLGPGASGEVVAAYQERLAELKLDPGPVDGRYGAATAYAVQAVQKITGLERTGTIGDAERRALETFQYPQPLQADGEADRTELDVTKQVITLYEDHQVRLITTTSTGSGERYCYNTPRVNPTRRVCEIASTPSGRFTYREFREGWDPSPLGRLYNPYYFNGGIAVHGYQSVPAGPASHGCARIPMHIAEYFHTLVDKGDPVYVFGGSPAEVLSSTPIAPTTTTVPPPPPVPVPAPTPPPTTPPTTAPPVTVPTTTTTTAPPAGP